MRSEYIQQLYVTLSVYIRMERWTVKPIQSSFLGELTAFQATDSWTFHWQACWILNIDTDVCAGQQSIKPSDYHWRKGERWKRIGVWLCVFLIRVRAPWKPAQKVYWLDLCVYGWRNKLNNTFANLCARLTCDDVIEKTKHAGSFGQRCRTVFELIFSVLDSEILHFASLLEVD